MRRVVRAGLIVAMAALAGCGSQPVVGVLLPTSGSASMYGESIESGVRVAVAEARDRNQLPPGFEVVWRDTESNPDTAVTELKRLVRESRTKIVIGGATSDEARALIPLLRDLGVVLLSPSASAPDLAEKSRLFYRVFPSDRLEGSRAGRFLAEELKAETAVLLTADNDYTAGIEPEFRKEYEANQGARILTRVNMSEEGWESEARTALEQSPASVYLVGYADQILEALRLLDEEGFGGKILTTSAFYSGRVIQEAGRLAEGVLFPLPPFDPTDDDELVRSFVGRYSDSYQRAPDVFAAHGYDAMNVVLQAITSVERMEAGEIANALHFSEFQGVTGPIRFDDYGEVKHYPTIFLIRDGKVLSYDRYLKEERGKILNDIRNLFRSQE